MLRLIVRYSRRYVAHIVVNVLLLLVQMVLQVFLLAREMKHIVDSGVAVGSMDVIYSSGVKMLLISLGAGVVALAASRFSAFITAGVTCDLRQDCYAKALSLSPRDFTSLGESAIVTRTIADVTQIQIFMINFLRSAVTMPLALIVIMVSIFLLNKTIFAVALGVFAATIVFMVVFGLRSKPYFARLQEQLDRLNLLVKEKITGVRTIRSFGNQALEEERMRAENQKAYDLAIVANDRINFLSPAAMIIMNWMVVVAYLIGDSHVKAGLTSVSDMLVIFQYLSYFTTMLAVIPMLLNLVPRTIVSSERINELLGFEQKNTYAGAQTPDITRGEIRFDSVAFGYEAGGRAVYDVSFVAKPGSTTAFIGATGSGKSTIINLAMGLMRPDSGTITIDGQPYDSLDMRSLSDAFALATQQALVFQDSARNNLTMYDERMSDVRIARALEASCFDEVVDAMPEGLDTMMAQGGRNISGGQRQRLSLARTVARDAAVYAFDDTFSALDSATEAKARRRIGELLCGKTVLMVAQKISTIKDADQIIVLDHGTIVDRGTHDELLATCSIYQEIYRTQNYLEGGESHGEA